MKLKPRHKKVIALRRAHKLSKDEILHNVLLYWRKQEKIFKEKVKGISAAAEHETNMVMLNKWYKWERNNINKCIQAQNEISKLVAQGVR